MNKSNELSQSFKDFLNELRLKIEDGDSDISEQFNNCCSDDRILIHNRLKYVTTEYTDKSPPYDGNTDYEIIFHDTIEDKFLSFTPHMSSWFEWEQEEEVYQESNWAYVFPVKSEETVWVTDKPSSKVVVQKEVLPKLDPMANEILATIKEMVSKGHISYNDLLEFYGYDDDGEIKDACIAQLQEKFGEFEEVAGWRSDFGDHDTYYKVIKFAKCETSFMGEGFYDSNNGVDFGYCSSLVPVVETEVWKMVWQEVKS